MCVSSAGSAGWSSYHLFLSRDVDAFLIGHLLPFLETEATAERLRRFFFIRYGEGRSLHLRLRFRPRRAAAATGLGERLECCVRAAAPQDPGLRLEEHPYRRSEHYFGESFASVQAELLNEATSWLALRLLRALGPEDRGRRWLTLASTLDLVARRAARGEGELLEAFTESCGFARLAARRLEQPLVGPPERAGKRWAAAVAAARPRVATALAGEPTLPRIAALLRRARREPGPPDGRRPEGGRFVATHALHLLANKLGFSLGEEHEAFATLKHLATHPPDGGALLRTEGDPT